MITLRPAAALAPSSGTTSGAAPMPPTEAAIAPAGQLVEVVGEAAESLLAAACAAVQRLGEPVVWILADEHLPHPGDLERAGVALESLVFVRLQGAASARGAEMLLASGAFGLVAVTGSGSLPDRSVARLRALCRRHGARLLIAPGPHRLLSGMVTLRVEARRRDGRLALQWAKDKAGVGPGLASLGLSLPAGVAPARRRAPVLPMQPVERSPASARSAASGSEECGALAIA